MSKMFAAERRNLILELLNQQSRITVRSLSKSLKVSEATLRTDLNVMEEEGLLTRTHGGAVLNKESSQENSFSERAKKNTEYKMAVAKKAVEFIHYKDCVVLDASTTALELARLLKHTELRITVVTNGISAALELKENPDINVILIGGMVRRGSMALEGLLGINTLEKINIDKIFTSASGFTISEGLTDFNVYEVELKKVLIEKASKVFALLDHTKMDKSSIASFATADQIDYIITDMNTPDHLLDDLYERDVQVIKASNIPSPQ
ncbi:transcriptional regulator, DeoR family [Halobacillus dabanensis]|uniref:Transcriptional regulator, DeoR family n=1 Tax=Halobacillus dabanensis TaxID=240302 RepID=A0A1I3S026_HALDA|nr:DeoR/GlpR family DNA-binding transcription regulator [Halobacillus dabanensis]SFJ52224.1 transcriptional regulator, DeoR family [Halobacillus dabanensis]